MIFFHQSFLKIPPNYAIGATFQAHGGNGSSHWVLQNVHEGGPCRPRRGSDPSIGQRSALLASPRDHCVCCGADSAGSGDDREPVLVAGAPHPGRARQLDHQSWAVPLLHVHRKISPAGPVSPANSEEIQAGGERREIDFNLENRNVVLPVAGGYGG